MLSRIVARRGETCHSPEDHMQLDGTHAQGGLLVQYVMNKAETT